MQYTIKQSNIAALLTVTDENGESNDYIYLAEGKLPVKGISCRVDFSDLPLPVQAAINRDFSMLFKSDIKMRSDLISNMIPYTVEG